jgi:hypothetical protein
MSTRFLIELNARLERKLQRGYGYSKTESRKRAGYIGRTVGQLSFCPVVSII